MSFKEWVIGYALFEQPYPKSVNLNLGVLQDLETRKIKSEKKSKEKKSNNQIMLTWRKKKI